MFDKLLKTFIFIFDSLLFAVFTFFMVGLVLYFFNIYLILSIFMLLFCALMIYLTFKTKNNDKYIFALSLIPSFYLLFEFINKATPHH